MKVRGITSMLAACTAVALVWLVGASGDEATLEAIPAPAPALALHQPPAPGPGRALDHVREAFGDEFVDPLGVAELSDSGHLVLPGDEFLMFDPYNAPTPEVIQPDGNSDAAVIVPLPTAPATIATTTVESVGTAEENALLSQPVKGRSSSRFGMRFHPILRVYKLHTGHDWAASCGTPVGAAAAGTVVRTGWAGGNGVQVKIDHGTLRGYRVVTTYNHLSSIGVKVGQKVTALQGIGRVGSTGYSTGCHLHFELIVNGQFTDPIPWLNGESTVVDLTEMDNLIIPTQPTLPPTDETEPPTVPALPESPTASASPTPSPEVTTPSPTGSKSPDPTITPSEPEPTETSPGPTETSWEPTPEPTETSPDPTELSPDPSEPPAEPTATPTETATETSPPASESASPHPSTPATSAAPEASTEPEATATQSAPASSTSPMPTPSAS